MPKKDAIHYLQKKYHFISYNAAYRQVQRGIEEWKNAHLVIRSIINCYRRNRKIMALPERNFIFKCHYST
jgi:hypothetical protein